MVIMKTSWEKIYGYAKKAGAKFPECVAAQWACESGFGAYTSGKNNFFGIKGTPGTTVSTQEWVNGKFITIQDTFKDYYNAEDCVIDLVNKWYKNYKGYEGVNRAKTREECAFLLKQEGYATDPGYSKKLVDLMNRYHTMPISNPATSPGFLRRAAEHYKFYPHQDAAFDYLEANSDPKVFAKFKELFSPPKVGVFKFPLDVPYFYQRDSKEGHGERMCFSSAMAMALDYLDPEAIAGDDDWYLNEVFKRGDTVSSVAQISTAHALGFTSAEFHTDGCEKDLITLLDRQVPVPIGILHKGPISSPTGGGHWVTLIGYDQTHFWVHDPYGELDLINGGYPKRGSTDGKAVRYTRQNLLKRWLIHSSSDGWYVSVI